VNDSKDCFENIIMKSEKILTFVVGFGQNTHMSNGPACKKKWITIYGNYKNIQDYMVGIGHSQDHWNIIPLDKITLNLPRMFNKVIYEMINAFMSNKPIFEPTHSWDFMDPHDDYDYTLSLALGGHLV
jgi:hypothetical protein